MCIIDIYFYGIICFLVCSGILCDHYAYVTCRCNNILHYMVLCSLYLTHMCFIYYYFMYSADFSYGCIFLISFIYFLRSGFILYKWFVKIDGQKINGNALFIERNEVNGFMCRGTYIHTFELHYELL